MIEVTASTAGATPLPCLQWAHLAARTRDDAKVAPSQTGPSQGTSDEPANTVEPPPRWPRVFPGL